MLMKKEMAVVLGIVVVAAVVFMAWQHFSSGKGNHSDSSSVTEEDTTSVTQAIDEGFFEKSDNPTFLEINSQIGKLEKMPWNKNKYKDIHAEIAASGSEGNGLMNEVETREITKKLELSYIITLDSAFQKLLNGGRSAIYDFPPLGSEIKKFAGTPYRANLQNQLAAVASLENLRKIEDEISTASGLTENDIEAYYRRILELERQPYFQNKALPREMVGNCTNQLSAALADIRERTLLRPLRLYVQEREYQQDSTFHYKSLLDKSISHALLSNNSRFRSGYQAGVKDLANHEDSHKRFDNWVEYKQSESCGQIFGKFRFYVNKCEEARSQGF